jgi:ATP-dependent helicase YprA (DUF1998 family)
LLTVGQNSHDCKQSQTFTLALIDAFSLPSTRYMSNNEAQGFYASSKITWSDTANQNVLMEQLTGPTFVPRPWQIDATATLLDGHDLLLIAGTGQGKSSIIYLPILARPDKMTFVVTPTILLAHDHVCAAIYFDEF